MRKKRLAHGHLFVWYDSLRPSQQYNRPVGMAFPGLNQY